MSSLLSKKVFKHWLYIFIFLNPGDKCLGLIGVVITKCLQKGIHFCIVVSSVKNNCLILVGYYFKSARE